MYGMVHKAIEDMVIAGHGEESWERIREKAGVEEEVFVRSEGYADEMTYGLVGTASEILQTAPAIVLEQFGIPCVTKTAHEGYADKMAAGGRTLPVFLENLPNFHSRVSRILPYLAPPRFLCSDVQPRAIHMHYLSQRTGLAPFVIGLFKGLGVRFAKPVTVEHIADKSSGAVHDEFVVSW